MALEDDSPSRTPLPYEEDSDAGSDEEMDWEEVVVPEEIPTEPLEQNAAAGNGDGSKLAMANGETIEITIKSERKQHEKSKQRVQNHEERQLRLVCHKVHTVALLCNALTRNQWINDSVLKARLLSLTPVQIQDSFSQITKKRFPDVSKRGRLFETAMMRLTQWWYEYFTVINRGQIRSRPFEEVQKLILETEDDDSEDGDFEIIRSPKSLMKHALQQWGNRDTSAQLFTSLCRALDIPARLVVSLQGVPWQANVGKPKPRPTGGPIHLRKEFLERRNNAATSSPVEDNNDDDMEEIRIPESPVVDRKGKGRAIFPGDGISLSGKTTPKSDTSTPSRPTVKLRKPRPVKQTLGSGSSRHNTPPAPVGGFPPVFWTEVFSRPDGRWMPVDPIRNIVNKRKVFEPPSHDKDNRMTYVVAVEEDGYCRDVTARYAKSYGAKTTKARLGGRGRKEWWAEVMALLTRPYRLHRDDVEDQEFEFNQISEGMPTSIAGFKDHPIYVLEQHLRREETVFPKTEIGKFRGESVYSRSNVISLKTAENWMRIGRKVKEGSQPMKWVKQRAVTIHRRRAMEQAQQEGDELMQGLYSQSQTELYVPDPVIDGIVPKNNFGNIDLYTPSMLPFGGAHVPYKGIAKIARQLGLDYAEAVTGFEFKKGRAFPIIEGVVIAKENEEALIEAFWETERDAEERHRLRRTERVLQLWTKLVQGLRIRERLHAQYAQDGPQNSDVPPEEDLTSGDVGGFIVEGADTVVQPFSLPRFQIGQFHPTEAHTGTAVENDELIDKMPIAAHPNSASESDEENDIEILAAPSHEKENSLISRVPLTMQELANSAAHSPLPSVAPQPAVNNDGPERGNDPDESILQGSKQTPRTRQRRKSSRRGETESTGSGDENPSSINLPSKRRRSKIAPTPIASSRVLRSRAPKSAEKMREEAEAEKAFLAATTE